MFSIRAKMLEVRDAVHDIKDVAMSNIPVVFKNEDASSPASLVQEATIVVLLVALVLIPLGLQQLAQANTTGLSAATVTAIGAIGVIVVASIVIAILNFAMKSKK